MGGVGEGFTGYDNETSRNTDYNGKDMGIFVEKVSKFYYASRPLKPFVSSAEILDSSMPDTRKFS